MDINQLAPSAQRLLDLLLRYFAAGGAAVLAFGASQSPKFAFLQLSGSPDISSWLLLLYVSIIGPAIYAVHRAALHQVVVRAILLSLPKRRSDGLAVAAADRQMSDKLNAWRAAADPWVATYEAWSAQIHFLYCVALGILLAMWLQYLTSSSPTTEVLQICGYAAALALFFAVLSDWRLNERQYARAFP